MNLLTEGLQRFGQSVLADDDLRPVVVVAELLQPGCLDALLLRIYGPQLMPSRRPVLVSQWAKYYFMHVIPPVLVAALASGWHRPLKLQQVALALDERGVPVAVKWLGEGGACDSEPFAGLLDDNLSPFIDALSEYGHLPAAVLWSSAGDVLESCLTQCAEMSDLPLDAGWALLSRRTRSDGRRNPLYQTISYKAQEDGSPPRRQRRACCLSREVEWVGRCEHCPLPA
ncbi:siderophore-iron reductase FhuF [Pseudomonas sp. v388]|uniref:siderophore-iron reductase FhuF n=1 Tax=Pseudomonas sp. v388 TaxID=2479849 RepID=UPI000F77414F|nr:siderophore-iron reductase FhuF [Pseudomonas sp. v388]RRV06912.1 siderophore-iron reductase FhuF [Pseudomonas sp. v388]